MQKKTDRLNLVFREGLTGVRVIRAFDKTRFEENRFDLANKDYTNTAIKVNTIVALMMPMMTLITVSYTHLARASCLFPYRCSPSLWQPNDPSQRSRY